MQQGVMALLADPTTKLGLAFCGLVLKVETVVTTLPLGSEVQSVLA